MRWHRVTREAAIEETPISLVEIAPHLESPTLEWAILNKRGRWLAPMMGVYLEEVGDEGIKGINPCRLYVLAEDPPRALEIFQGYLDFAEDAML